MGSVPNCRKEIPVRNAIRWFKCKLKPPNKPKELITVKTDICRSKNDREVLNKKIAEHYGVVYDKRVV